MATFKPAPSQIIANPANAYRPGRAIADVDGTAFAAGQQARAQLIAGAQQFEAKKARVAAEDARRTAAAAARELELEALRLARQAEAEGLEDGTDLVPRFTDGFVSADGTTVMGFTGLVDQFGM